MLTKLNIYDRGYGQKILRIKIIIAITHYLPFYSTSHSIFQSCNMFSTILFYQLSFFRVRIWPNMMLDNVITQKNMNISSKDLLVIYVLYRQLCLSFYPSHLWASIIIATCFCMNISILKVYPHEWHLAWLQPL